MFPQGHSPALAVETALIQNRLAGDACLSYRIGQSQQTMQSYTLAAEARFSECEMTLETSSTSAAMGTTSSFRVLLSQLDPARIRVTDGLKVAPNSIAIGDLPLFSILLVTTRDQKAIEAVRETIQDGTTKRDMQQASGLDIPVKSMEAATRLADAFRRAITLCAADANNKSKE